MILKAKTQNFTVDSNPVWLVSLEEELRCHRCACRREDAREDQERSADGKMHVKTSREAGYGNPRRKMSGESLRGLRMSYSSLSALQGYACHFLCNLDSPILQVFTRLSPEVTVAISRLLLLSLSQPQFGQATLRSHVALPDEDGWPHFFLGIGVLIWSLSCVETPGSWSPLPQSSPSLPVHVLAEPYHTIGSNSPNSL